MKLHQSYDTMVAENQRLAKKTRAGGKNKNQIGQKGQNGQNGQNQSPNPFTCESCELTWTSSRPYLDHLKHELCQQGIDYVAAADVDLDGEVVAAIEKNFHCEWGCQFPPKTHFKSFLRQHTQLHLNFEQGVKDKCEECEMAWKEPRHLVQHWDSKVCSDGIAFVSNGRKNPYKEEESRECDRCGFTWSLVVNKANHMKLHENYDRHVGNLNHVNNHSNLNTTTDESDQSDKDSTGNDSNSSDTDSSDDDDIGPIRGRRGVQRKAPLARGRRVGKVTQKKQNTKSTQKNTKLTPKNTKSSFLSQQNTATSPQLFICNECELGWTRKSGLELHCARNHGRLSKKVVATRNNDNTADDDSDVSSSQQDSTEEESD